ncbi:unnamed protein product [Boreogadus saida]
MDDERLVVEVEKYVELYDQSSRHYKDNSKKVIAWRAIALEIGSSGDFLHLYCSAAVAPPPVGARGVLLTRVKCAPCRCGAVEVALPSGVELNILDVRQSDVTYLYTCFVQSGLTFV